MRKGWRTRVVEFVFADIHFNLKLPMSFLAEIPTVEPQVSTLCIEFPAFVMRLSTPPPVFEFMIYRGVDFALTIALFVLRVLLFVRSS